MTIKAIAGLISAAYLMSLPMLSQAADKTLSQIQIEYQVYKGDFPFATTKEQFERKGKAYQLTSHSKGHGIFALLGERILTSKGQVNANGLVPNTFHLQQGDKLKAATFDWKNEKISMQNKGKTHSAALIAGTQDLISFAYQFRFKPPVAKQPYHVSLTTGKKLKHYTYQVETQTIELDGKPVNCLHLFQEKPGKESKEFWVAKAYHYLPVYSVFVDKHGQRLEQTLTKFSAH